MDEQAVLADQFEAQRAHLTAVAYRMLGSLTEADDAVQEAWLRLHRTDATTVENLGGWLTTVVSRVCLDMLRIRTRRAEEPLSETGADEVAPDDPEREALLADSVGMAMHVVLGTLQPAERVAFVLHDMFAVSFEEIGRITDRSSAAARQLASRGRRKVQNRDSRSSDAVASEKAVVDAFLTAAREGDFEALLCLLDPNAVLRADASAMKMGVNDLDGAEAVAGRFNGGAQSARKALLDGEPGLVWAMGGEIKMIFEFLIDRGRIVAIEMVADADRLSATKVEFLTASGRVTER